MKVKVDQSLCMGCGTCVGVAPKTFELDNQAKSVIKKKDGIKTEEFVNYYEINDTEKNILNAAKSCPANAIVIIEVDEQGKEIKQIWPS